MDKQPRHIEQIVEQQIKRWMATDAALREAAERAATRPAAPPPPITVSREFGAQGEQIARLVAERMGFACWDKELLTPIAASTQAPMQLLQALDERRRTAIERVVDAWNPSGPPSDTTYLRELARVVHTLAAQGSAVIVGRGAQFILGPTEALHVRVIAPLETRVQGLVTRKGWTEAQARAEVKRMDDERDRFLRASFGRDPSDPHAYDLVINGARLPLAGAATLIEAAWRAKFPRE